MKLNLVPDWRESYRWFSMHAMGWSLGLIGSWAALPPDLKALVPEWLLLLFVAVLLFLGMVGRVIEQPPSQLPGAP
jgi:hypothetical protein